MNESSESPLRCEAVESAAAEWLVKHDRGLTPRQQDEFLQWLAASPAHRESFNRHRQMWADFNALAYVLLGQGYAGAEGRAIKDHELVVFGPGDALTLRAADHQDGPSPALEVLLLGGLPIREPIAHYGPFVMNTREEILQAIADYQAGRMGQIPAVHGLTPNSTP